MFHSRPLITSLLCDIDKSPRHHVAPLRYDASFESRIGACWAQKDGTWYNEIMSCGVPLDGVFVLVVRHVKHYAPAYSVTLPCPYQVP